MRFARLGRRRLRAALRRDRPRGAGEYAVEDPPDLAAPKRIAARGEPAPQAASGVAGGQDPDDVVGPFPAADERRQADQAGRLVVALRGKNLDPGTRSQLHLHGLSLISFPGGPSTK